MIKSKYFLSLFLIFFSLTIIRYNSVAQQIEMTPTFLVKHATNSSHQFNLHFWPVGSYYFPRNHNFKDTLTVTNQFGGTSNSVTTILPAHAQFLFPMQYVVPSTSPANSILKGKISLTSKLQNNFKFNTSFEYSVASEQSIIANRKPNETFTTITTPSGDATYKFNQNNIDPTPFGNGISYFLLSSSENATKTRSSESSPRTDINNYFNTITTYSYIPKPLLPAGWRQVSNVISIEASRKATQDQGWVYIFRNSSEFKIKYDSTGLSPVQESNIALFYWGGQEQAWHRYKCKNDAGASLDTLKNEFTLNFDRTGTYMLASMDDVHFTSVKVAPNTVSFRYAGKTLLLSGSVDSTAFLSAFAGKEIILADGFRAKPGSVLSFKLTNDYCGMPQAISNARVSNEAETTSIVESSPEVTELLKVFPNPTNTIFTVSYVLPIPQMVRISLKDNLGKEAKLLQNGYQDAGEYNLQYNIQDLAAGIYFIEIKTETEKVKVTKLIKQ